MASTIPKDPKLRQRRNIPRSRATLQAVVTVRQRMPSLPEREQPWHPRTVAWWKHVWRSPMAAEYLETDIDGLGMLAELIDRFWDKPNAVLAGEIRQQRQCFGLTPLDRRRLEWQVERVEAEKEKRPAVAPVREPADDPRAMLSVV